MPYNVLSSSKIISKQYVYYIVTLEDRKFGDKNNKSTKEKVFPQLKEMSNANNIVCKEENGYTCKYIGL